MMMTARQWDGLVMEALEHDADPAAMFTGLFDLGYGDADMARGCWGSFRSAGNWMRVGLPDWGGGDVVEVDAIGFDGWLRPHRLTFYRHDLSSDLPDAVDVASYDPDMMLDVDDAMLAVVSAS